MKGSQVIPGSRLWIPWYQIAKEWNHSYKARALFLVEIKERVPASGSPKLLFTTEQGYLVWLDPEKEYQQPIKYRAGKDSHELSWYLPGGRLPSTSKGVSID